MKKLIFAVLAALLSAPSAFAQVQLGGHVFVPSSTDSTDGMAVVNFTANGDCNVVTQTNCTLTTFTGSGSNASLPYTGMLVIYDPDSVLTGPVNILVPLSPGRRYTVENNTAQSLQVQSPALEGGVTVGVYGIVPVKSDGMYYNVEGCTATVPATGGYIPEFDGESYPCSMSASPLFDTGSAVTSSEPFVLQPGGWIPYTPDSESTEGYYGYYYDESLFYGANYDPSTNAPINSNLDASYISLGSPPYGNGGCITMGGSGGIASMSVLASFCPYATETALTGIELNAPVLYGDATQTDVTSSRSLDTVYHNTTGYVLTVSGAADISGGSGDSTVACLDGVSDTPTTVMYENSVSSAISGEGAGFMCRIPQSYYYEITQTNIISTTPLSWIESTF